MIEVKIGPATARIDAYVWQSEHKPLADLLNAMLPAGGPSGSDPAPDWNAARAAAERLGGRVTSPAPKPAPVVAGRVY